ncbi:farnesol dehydrogenase-like [Musca autumnalis]|uniref:farnesol dehydrogenase-like n=1 Tax=Musca autumnalis TaxID=221902 RepID=UPI003CF91353
MDKWHNKVAVVTGASAGIGAACCKALVDNGMIVIGLARRPERIDEIHNSSWPDDEEKQKRLHSLKCDVRQETQVVEAFAKIVKDFGPIAVLINNAGIVRSTELVRENNTEDLRAIVDTNIMGVAFCTREAFKSMSKNSDGLGHVIIINSVAGHRVIHFEGMSTNMYPASKHAITAMTEVYRNEFLMHNTKIRVTSISPGVVRTEIFTEQALEMMKDFPFLEASDIADAVIYCLQTPAHVQIHELTIKPVGEKF